MPVPAEKVEELIIAHIEEATVELEDTMGDQNHYRAVVTSPAFAGKSRIECHRLVNASLKELGEDLHAISIETKTPSES